MLLLFVLHPEQMLLVTIQLTFFLNVSSRYHPVSNINLDSSKTPQAWQQNDSCRERLLHSDQCYV